MLHSKHTDISWLHFGSSAVPANNALLRCYEEKGESVNVKQNNKKSNKIRKFKSATDRLYERHRHAQAERQTAKKQTTSYVLTVDLAEHFVHVLMIVVVKKDGGTILSILIKWH